MDKSFSYQKHIIAYLDILNFKKSYRMMPTMTCLQPCLP